MEHARSGGVAPLHDCTPHAAIESVPQQLPPRSAAVHADAVARTSIFAGDVCDTSTWTQLVDCALPEMRRACFFCGALDTVNRRSIFLRDVGEILERQLQHGVVEPVSTCMRNLVCVSNFVSQNTPGLEGEAVVNSCMCCYHWVARRQLHNIVRLPMQNMYWYVKNVDHHGRRNYDARMLHRLAVAITSPHGERALRNYYASLFDSDELTTLQNVARAPVSDLHDIVTMHYYTHNNNSLFVTEPSIMDAVRAAKWD